MDLPMHWLVFFTTLQTVLIKISRGKNRILRILALALYVSISSTDLVADHLLLQRSFRRIFEHPFRSMQSQWQ
jgi:hypothetical protein